jgi:hypothetical protein
MGRPRSRRTTSGRYDRAAEIALCPSSALGTSCLIPLTANSSICTKSWLSSTTSTQTREDGVSIGHVVLSAEKYLTTRPDTAKNDRPILPATIHSGKTPLSAAEETDRLAQS